MNERLGVDEGWYRDQVMSCHVVSMNCKEWMSVADEGETRFNM